MTSLALWLVLFMVLGTIISVGISCPLPSIDIPYVGELLDGFGIDPEFMVGDTSCSGLVVEVHLVQVILPVLATRSPLS